MMQLFARLFAFVLLLALAPLPAATVQTITHRSTALGRDHSYNVWVPDDAAKDRPYPVLYVLHGAWGNHEDWPTKSRVADWAKDLQMILVFPDGGKFGWYVDSPLEPSSQFETYVAKELVADVDGRFPTIPTRGARGIMGLSMGGHGAITLAAKHPEVFGSASSLSGILRLENHPRKWEIAQRLGPLATQRHRWEANSAYHLAERLQQGSVRVLFDCGIEDRGTGAITDNRQFHKRLNELRIPHIYREFPGNHTWEYWNARLPQHLNFHQAIFTAATPKLEKWFEFYFKRVDSYLAESAAQTMDRTTSPTLCLFGSSSAQGMPSDLFPGWHVYNRGISADRLGVTSRGLSKRMQESVLDVQPDVVVVKNGRNDLSARHRSGKDDPSIPRLIEEFDVILAGLQGGLPRSRILVTSSFPVRDKYAHLAGAIVEYNAQLRLLAEKRGVPYLDVHALLVGSDGLLKPEYSADGLHLSAAGKALWAQEILKAAAR